MLFIKSLLLVVFFLTGNVLRNVAIETVENGSSNLETAYAPGCSRVRMRLNPSASRSLSACLHFFPLLLFRKLLPITFDPAFEIGCRFL
jgi:hypothetical protein